MLSSIGFALAVVASMAHAEVILVRLLLIVYCTIVTDSCVAAECRRSASECQRARDAAPCGPRQQGRHHQLHVSAQRARPVSLPDHLACYTHFACLPCSARASLVTPFNPSTYSATGPAPSIPLLHLAISSLHLRLSTHSFSDALLHAGRETTQLCRLRQQSPALPLPAASAARSSTSLELASISSSMCVLALVLLIVMTLTFFASHDPLGPQFLRCVIVLRSFAISAARVARDPRVDYSNDVIPRTSRSFCDLLLPFLLWISRTTLNPSTLHAARRMGITRMTIVSRAKWASSTLCVSRSIRATLFSSC